MSELKIRTSVRCGKPPKNMPIRVRSESEASHYCWLLERGRDHYIVADSVRSVLREHVRAAVLRLAVDPAGEPFLIPEMKPGADLKLHPWCVSRNAALRVAEGRWVRLVPNLRKASYEVFASTEVGEPSWPEESMEELVGLAFAGRVIDDASHPLVDIVLTGAE